MTETRVPPREFTQIARRYGHLLLSIVVLVWLLVRQVPPAFAAAWAIAVIAVTETVKQLLASPATPWRGALAACRVLVRGIDDGVRAGAQLAIVIAAIGLFVDVLVTTGLAQKLSYMLFDVASDKLWLLLGMTALACLVFGFGMPTPAAYILVALLGVPALERAGVPELSAHMFVFYFANLSAITPPVAVAALVASKLADADYFRTTAVACRYGLAGFVLPFMFVYAPAILLLEGSLARQWATFAGILIGLVAINAALIGFLYRPLGLPYRLLTIVAAALVLRLNPYPSFAGIALLVAVVALQRWRDPDRHPPRAAR